MEGIVPHEARVALAPGHKALRLRGGEVTHMRAQLGEGREGCELSVPETGAWSVPGAGPSA